MEKYEDEIRENERLEDPFLPQFAYTISKLFTIATKLDDLSFPNFFLFFSFFQENLTFPKQLSLLGLLFLEKARHKLVCKFAVH